MLLLDPKLIGYFSCIQNLLTCFFGSRISQNHHLLVILCKDCSKADTTWAWKTQYISYINTFLSYIYSIQKTARYTSSSSVFKAFITYVGAQLRRKPLYSIVLLLKLFAKPLPKFQIIQMQLFNHRINSIIWLFNHLIIILFDYSIIWLFKYLIIQ